MRCDRSCALALALAVLPLSPAAALDAAGKVLVEDSANRQPKADGENLLPAIAQEASEAIAKTAASPGGATSR